MDRAQVHTLEAFLAALLLVSGIIFATQATAVTPLSASTSNQYIENQQRGAANDLLATADERGDLREAVAYWNATEEEFDGATEHGFYTDGGPPNAFGEALNETFGERRIAFNVYVRYWDERENETVRRSQTMVYMGSPSDNAVTASRTVALFDETPLSAPDQSHVVSDPDANFYARDIDDGRLYNLMEVRIVVWRM